MRRNQDAETQRHTCPHWKCVSRALRCPQPAPMISPYSKCAESSKYKDITHGDITEKNFKKLKVEAKCSTKFEHRVMQYFLNAYM